MHAECSASCQQFNLTNFLGSDRANSAECSDTSKTRRSRDKTAIMAYTVIAPTGRHPALSGATKSSRSRSAQVSSLRISICHVTKSYAVRTHSSRRSRSFRRRRLKVRTWLRRSMARLTRPLNSLHRMQGALLRIRFCLWKTMLSI